MSLVEEIEARYREALKNRDTARTSALRMVRARLKQYAIDQRQRAALSDAQAREVVAGYVKQLQKSIPEFEKAGPAGAERVAALRAEIAILDPFLPQLLDERATRDIVAAAVAELSDPPPQRAGQVIGHVMKGHKGEVDPALVRRLVEEALQT